MALKGERREYLPEIMVPDAGRLGRLLHHDPRSRSFAAVDLLDTKAAKKPGVQTWWRRGVYDQGSTSSCVGQATAACLLTSPNRHAISRRQQRDMDGYALYRVAQGLDPWPGQEPDYYGTSTLAGMKAAKQMGLISEYRWCFGLDDTLATLTSLGPVVIGTLWLASMDHPAADGTLTVDPDSMVRGGHATLLVGVNAEQRTVRGVNSWGEGWGDGGRFTLSWDDLGWLLDQEGEAVTVLLPERQAGEEYDDDADEDAPTG